jgi:hypothetical protein
LSQICAQLNDRYYVDVPTTVGFCMYIRRQALVDIGHFDAKNFPLAYGEESDFCYRARKAGWRHSIAGDAYVEHFENKSFGDRKHELKQRMLSAFARLHPELSDVDRRFARQDPLLPLRKRMDLGRLKRLLAGADALRVSLACENNENHRGVALVLDTKNKNIAFACGLGKESLPNIRKLKLPRDIAEFNWTLQILGVARLACDDEYVLREFQSLVGGQAYEVPVIAPIEAAAIKDGIGP